MTVVGSSRYRTLAVHPTSRGFGWVVCEGPLRLVEFGVCVPLRGSKRVACVRKTEKLIARLAPSELVIEAFDERSGKGAWVRKLSLDLVTVAADRSLSIEAHTRDAVRAAFEAVGARTRRETAEAVARHFPALAYRLPSPRKAWESEDKRLAIFHAAAVVLAHFHNGATALLRERGSAA